MYRCSAVGGMDDRQLADHLHIMHAVYTGDVVRWKKTKDPDVGLVAAHTVAHSGLLGAYVPHTHAGQPPEQGELDLWDFGSTPTPGLEEWDFG